MEFKIVWVDQKSPKKQREKRATPSWEAKGIEVSRYMRHPTCPFCGLEDEGKDAPVRPDRNHMIACVHRKMDPYPMSVVDLLDEDGKPTGETDTRGRVGSFLGERIPRQLRFPVRRMYPIKVPILDEKGDPTGQFEEEPNWACSYDWKIETVHDWVWAGEKWVEWFNWGKRPQKEE